MKELKNKELVRIGEVLYKVYLGDDREIILSPLKQGKIPEPDYDTNWQNLMTQVKKPYWWPF